MKDSKNDNVLMHTDTYSMSRINDMQNSVYMTTFYSFSSTTQEHQFHLKHSSIQMENLPLAVPIVKRKFPDQMALLSCFYAL